MGHEGVISCRCVEKEGDVRWQKFIKAKSWEQQNSIVRGFIENTANVVISQKFVSL